MTSVKIKDYFADFLQDVYGVDKKIQIAPNLKPFTFPVPRSNLDTMTADENKRVAEFIGSAEEEARNRSGADLAQFFTNKNAATVFLEEDEEV